MTCIQTQNIQSRRLRLNAYQHFVIHAGYFAFPFRFMGAYVFAADTRDLIPHPPRVFYARVRVAGGAVRCRHAQSQLQVRFAHAPAARYCIPVCLPAHARRHASTFYNRHHPNKPPHCSILDIVHATVNGLHVLAQSAIHRTA